jgi:hypothetical protein
MSAVSLRIGHVARMLRVVNAPLPRRPDQRSRTAQCHQPERGVSRPVVRPVAPGVVDPDRVLGWDRDGRVCGENDVRREGTSGAEWYEGLAKQPLGST